jgi:hypothetical protein
VRSPYLGALWDPVPVIAVYGRNAKEKPTCAAKVCVHHGWKEVLLPIMEDPTWPPDTLFIVAEEDWRLREQDEWIEAQTNSVNTEFERNALKAGVEATQVQQRVPGQAPRSLCDIVGFSVQAQRKHHGDLIWLSYMRQQKSKSGHDGGPNYGSALLALNQRAARVIAKWIQQGPPSKVEHHFDCWLRQRLIEDGKSPNREIWASYPYPCIGSFVEHASGCQPNIGTRASEWSLEWVQEGTRIEDSTIKAGRNRCLLPFPRTAATPKDRLCWLTPAATAHEWWRTLAPEDIHPLLHPVRFWGGVPSKIDLVSRTGGQEFENLCFVCTGYPKIVDDTEMAGTARRSKKRALQQQHPFDDPNEGLQDSDRQVTDRQRRNWRKTRATFYKGRMWTKTPAPCLHLMLGRGKML